MKSSKELCNYDFNVMTIWEDDEDPFAHMLQKPTLPLLANTFSSESKRTDNNWARINEADLAYLSLQRSLPSLYSQILSSDTTKLETSISSLEACVRTIDASHQLHWDYAFRSLRLHGKIREAAAQFEALLQPTTEANENKSTKEHSFGDWMHVAGELNAVGAGFNELVAERVTSYRVPAESLHNISDLWKIRAAPGFEGLKGDVDAPSIPHTALYASYWFTWLSAMFQVWNDSIPTKKQLTKLKRKGKTNNEDEAEDEKTHPCLLARQALQQFADDYVKGMQKLHDLNTVVGAAKTSDMSFPIVKATSNSYVWCLALDEKDTAVESILARVQRARNESVKESCTNIADALMSSLRPVKAVKF